MSMTASQVQAWRQHKANLLLPIVYVRGFAAAASEIEETSADPFNGFNVGSTLLRTGWTGDSRRHVFESPVLRLTQPPFGYRVAFSDGIRGLDKETQDSLADWAAANATADAGTRSAILAIYRYYDAASSTLGSGQRPGMEAYGWGLGRLILDVMNATGAGGVYVVAHSMGGLVARTFLQNDEVLDGSGAVTGARCAAVAKVLQDNVRLRMSSADWARARMGVRRLFTYGTPHNGITIQGGLGNGVLGLLDFLGMELSNFDHDRMREYLGGASAANSLDGRFPVENAFCLVGTSAADYPVAAGMSRRLIGQLSDGLVEIDNAVVHGPRPPTQSDPAPTALAARAYVRRAHSGPYGLVNSEEGFGNLTRFLFGDLRVDGDLVVKRIDLPADLQRRKDATPAGQDAGIRASYSFEVLLRVRGARWALTERLARDGTAIFRRYDELVPRPAAAAATASAARHRRVELFSAFLDTKLRTRNGEPDIVEGQALDGTLGFALRLRVAVPDYEVDGSFWRTYHYEGSALLDTDLAFLAYEDAAMPGGWGLAYGPASADTDNTRMRIVHAAANPASPPADDAYWVMAGNAVEFWIPVNSDGPPAFQSWLRLTGRQWNAA